VKITIGQQIEKQTNIEPNTNGGIWLDVGELAAIRGLYETEEERGQHCVCAQTVNENRVKWKNEINNLVGSPTEYKKYGK